jgi:hypothetical protein
VATYRRRFRPVLVVADMLDALEAERGGFEADELSEEGNPR